MASANLGLPALARSMTRTDADGLSLLIAGTR
jgi:hypothetical protein